MHPRELSIFDLTYDLPQEKIAQQPLAVRDASKLLVYQNGAISDRTFHELPALLPRNCLLVLNNTRVVNARILFLRATGGRVEVFCLEPVHGPGIEAAFAQKGAGLWTCMLGNARKWRLGEKLALRSDGLTLEAERTAHDQVAFTWSPADRTFAEVLNSLGHVPLPPYMTRPDDAADKLRYNTVIARHDGSVAAPTASLHFTPAILEQLNAYGHSTTELTLHVGAGTFLQVKSPNMAGHQMHREQVHIPLTVLQDLASRLGNAPLGPVGTTALRSLESIYWHGVKIMQGRAGVELDIEQWEPYDHTAALPSAAEALDAVITHIRSHGLDQCTGSTRLLVAPGYTFRFTDALVTNFHQPQSTLLLLVAALVGDDWREVYAHALQTGYRFLSYGDSSLLFKNSSGKFV